jgi:hypothetical protein
MKGGEKEGEGGRRKKRKKEKRKWQRGLVRENFRPCSRCVRLGEGRNFSIRVLRLSFMPCRLVPTSTRKYEV